jgi:threonine dehydratase
MAGSGVIGLEILDDLPDVAPVVAPWGGDGLCCGIALALKALLAGIKVYASEIDAGAPLSPSLAAGRPVEVTYAPSFADGIGSPFVNAEMFGLARRVVGLAIVVSREQAAATARLIVARTGVVPEGAAAPAVAALTARAGDGPIACVVSGGNVDPRTLVTILRGGTPP